MFAMNWMKHFCVFHNLSSWDKFNLNQICNCTREDYVFRVRHGVVCTMWPCFKCEP